MSGPRIRPVFKDYGNTGDGPKRRATYHPQFALFYNGYGLKDNYEVYRNTLPEISLALQAVAKVDDAIMEILKDTSLSSRDESARAAAVLRWTVQQAWSSSCRGAQTTKDLLVLGVPRAHATALGEAVDSGRAEYERKCAEDGFMVNRVTDVSATPGPEGSADTIKLTLFTDDVFTGEQGKNELLIDRSQAKVLLAELKTAHKKMEELEE